MKNPLFKIRKMGAKLFRILALMGMLGSWLAPPFNVSSAPAEAPTLLAPANSAMLTAVPESGSLVLPPLAMPEFEWSAVSGATLYQLHISQDIGFTNKLDITTPNPSYIPYAISQFNDGTWYWRVRVAQPEYGDWSTIWSFSRQWASPNNAPILTAPGNGAVLEFYDHPTFSWDSVPGAAYYRIQISAASDFAALAYYATTLTTTHQPAFKLPNGTYYWRITPLDPANHEGTYSVVRSFTLAYNKIPVLLEPANASTPTFTPTFRWTAVQGASYYELNYSTDPSFSTAVIPVTTRNTSFTPLDPLPNDVNYYWRVRAVSGSSISDWSPQWNFRKQWYIQPQLLTPTNNSIFNRTPYFSWTPVPGTSYYFVELDVNDDFVGADSYITSNTFLVPDRFNTSIRYWRVTPVDRSGYKGLASATWYFEASPFYNAPQLVYPHYYYTPNNFPPPDQAVDMLPYEDRTVAWPIFVWNRVHTPNPDGRIYAPAYRLEVSTDKNFSSIAWTVDSEHTHATPTMTNPFAPSVGVTYYWRVCPLTTTGGDCKTNEFAPYNEWWSQTWAARFDSSLQITPSPGAAPEPIRPFHGQEFVEATPLFEWTPIENAAYYEIQVSNSASFDQININDQTPYPAFAPTTVLAQRQLLDRLEFGTYYWRVRAYDAGDTPGDWSVTRRFQVAAQSQLLRSRAIGDAKSYLIASDADDTTDSNFELTGLFATQELNAWYFGFDYSAGGTDMIYALLLDVDHDDNSGGSGLLPASNFSVDTIPAHRPEFVILIRQISSAFPLNQTAVYEWNGASWNAPDYFYNIGGQISANGSYLELRVPGTAIGKSDTTGSYAVSLVSAASIGGGPVDSTPHDPTIPGGTQISRFSSISEKVNLVTPPNSLGGDPSTYSFFSPFFWDQPMSDNGTHPWAGVKVEANLDPQFTGDVAGTSTIVSDLFYYMYTYVTWISDLRSDNSYYWRARMRYTDSFGEYWGVWSESARYERIGLVPENLQTSVTFATPTFHWDLVEGAESYDIQVDNDQNFGSPAVNSYTTGTSFTPVYTLENGTYYWRVRARRYASVINDWSQVETFTLSLPIPSGLTPNDPSANLVVGTTPTFCWDPLLVSDSEDIPVLAAWKYRLQVSLNDPTFSSVYETVDTEQTCWTPTRGFDDGTYYWRVAMLDGENKQGEYSAAAVLTKQYPITTLVSPLDGATIPSVPTFIWSPVDGAAYYRLEISQYSTFSPVYDSMITNNVKYRPTTAYQTNRAYYWRVAIQDYNGKVGPYNDATIILDPQAGANKLFVPYIGR